MTESGAGTPCRQDYSDPSRSRSLKNRCGLDIVSPLSVGPSHALVQTPQIERREPFAIVGEATGENAFWKRQAGP